MSLTLGSGPIAPRKTSTAQWNVSFEGAPAHKLVFQPDPRRLRALIGDQVVLDTTRAHLLHESAIMPVVYAPLEDYLGEGWQDTDTSTHCPFKGDAAYRSYVRGEQTLADLMWLYPEPLPAAEWLLGFGALDAARVDAWFVEDDRVVGHLRDPYHRVDAHLSSRPVLVRRGGDIVAQSDKAILVFETGLPVRAYVPPADVRPGAISHGSGLRSVCPYKGEATYWNVGPLEDAAWSYETPLPDVLRAQAHLCFDDSVEGLDVEIG